MARARRIALRADPARCEIALVIPRRASEKAAWKFAHENRAWILAALSEMERPIPFVDGAVFPIFGIDRTLRIIKTDKRVTEIDLKDDRLEVRTSREDPTRNIRDFLYKLALDTVTAMANQKAALIDKKVKSVHLRDTRARWGSCAPDGRLMFCWRLVFAPMVIVEYVVGHEVAHLREMNHGPKFWALCDDLTEQMEYSRAWLAANGDKLLSYGVGDRG